VPAERDENACRKDMTPSEKVALGKALEALERPRAEERVGGRPPKTAENLPQVSGQTGRVREIVGEASGRVPVVGRHRPGPPTRPPPVPAAAVRRGPGALWRHAPRVLRALQRALEAEVHYGP